MVSMEQRQSTRASLIPGRVHTVKDRLSLLSTFMCSLSLSVSFQSSALREVSHQLTMLCVLVSFLEPLKVL